MTPRKRAPGGGRKPLPESERKRRKMFRLHPDVIAHVEEQPNQSAYIEDLVRQDRDGG